MPLTTPISASDAYALFARRESLPTDPVFMGVTSTGIFCRPGCPARLPKLENCLFFPTPKEALEAGFRACKRCHPTRQPGEQAPLVKRLIALIESDPERRWGERDLTARGIDPSTARRQFQARFHMSFAQYARARRLAFAHQTLQKGDPVIQAQLSAGYESASGFRSAFSQTFGQAPKNSTASPLYVDWIDTPLGPMMTIADEAALYLLEFTDRKNLQRQLTRLSQRQKRAIIPGKTPITDQIAEEIKAYFDGTLSVFQTPLQTSGTEFQTDVWDMLRQVPFGQTWSYSDLAARVGNAKAVRAVASSNANNGLAIIIPCHRIVGKDGGLGGYAGGLTRKSWLIEHEARISHARS